MAINLTLIFGNEISVAVNPRDTERQYAGFAGAHGIVSMFMGSHGYSIAVSGTLRASGANYAAARAALIAAIRVIEAYQWADAADYTFFNDTYENIVWDKLQIIPDNSGKQFHYDTNGECLCRFVMPGRSLI